MPKRYFKTINGRWISEEEFLNTGYALHCKDYDPEKLLKQGGFYGQYLSDGSFEDRDDIITIKENGNTTA